MHSFLLTIIITSAICLVVLVLLHSAKSDGLGAIGGTPALFNSQKGLETGLNRVTTGVAVVFMLSAFILSALQ